MFLGRFVTDNSSIAYGPFAISCGQSLRTMGNNVASESHVSKMSVASRLGGGSKNKLSTLTHSEQRSNLTRGNLLGAAGCSVAISEPMTNGEVPHRPNTPPSSGRDELNLIDFPISVLQYQQPLDADGNRPDELVCVIRSFDRYLGEVVPRKLTRRTASKHGFPTPLEEEVLIALLTLTRLKNNFTSPRVSFRNAELFDLMGWPSNGNSSERLGVALDRLKGLTLKYENAWTTGKNKYEKEFTTGLLDSYQFVVQTMGNGEGKAESWVQWASEVFADIQQGNVKELNTDRYFSLDRPIARRLYRFLDKHLDETPQFKMELLTFAAHLGISGTTHIGKIKERLMPGVKALEAMGDFIEPMAPKERFVKRGAGDWCVQFARASRQEAGTRPKRPVNNRRENRLSDTAAKTLVSEFYSAWSGDPQHLVTRHELHQAQTVIGRYGADYAGEMLPVLVKVMKQQFPEARAFGAANNYWHDADKAIKRRQTSQQKEKEPLLQREAEQSKLKEEQARLEARRTRWNQLTQQQQDAIRNRVAEVSNQTVKRFISLGKFADPLVERACLNEMERAAEAA